MLGRNVSTVTSPGPSLGTFHRMLQFWELFDCDQQTTLYGEMGGVFSVDGSGGARAPCLDPLIQDVASAQRR